MEWADDDVAVTDAGYDVVLRRSSESGTTVIRYVRDYILCEHVDAQRGDGGDDDAGGDRDFTEDAAEGGAVGSREQVLQGGGACGGVRNADRRDQHADGDRCQLDTGGDVEEPQP